MSLASRAAPDRHRQGFALVEFRSHCALNTHAARLDKARGKRCVVVGVLAMACMHMHQHAETTAMILAMSWLTEKWHTYQNCKLDNCQMSCGCL